MGIRAAQGGRNRPDTVLMREPIPGLDHSLSAEGEWILTSKLYPATASTNVLTAISQPKRPKRRAESPGQMVLLRNALAPW